MMKSKNVKVLVKLMLSGFILLILFLTIDLNELKSIYANIQIKYFLWILILLPFSLFARIYRWYYLYNRKKDHNISILFSAKVTFAGLALNIFMPAQSGDLVKAYYGYKWSGVKEKMISISLYDKLIAIASVGVLGIVPALYYQKIWFTIAATFSFSPLIMLIVFFRSERLSMFLNPIVVKLTRSKIKLNRLKDGFDFKVETIIKSLILSIIGWLSSYLILWFCFLILNQETSQMPTLSFVLMISPILTLVRLFPFTLNGLGSDEAIAVAMFNIVDVMPEITLSAAIIYKLILVFFPALVGLIIIFTTKNKDKNQHQI